MTHWGNEEIIGEIRKFKTTENGNKTSQNLWNSSKLVLREEFMAMEAFLKKQENSQKKKKTNLPPKGIRKRTATIKKPKVSRRKEIITIREEINEIEI